MRQQWTDEELTLLKDLCAQHADMKTLQKTLPGRDRNVIRKKCITLGLTYKQERIYWSEEETSQFCHDWKNPSISMQALCRKYKNRNKAAITAHARHLKLGARPHDDSYLTISDIVQEMHVTKDKVRYWILHGLKTHTSKIPSHKYLIDADDLLKFLEQHQNWFNAAEISPYLFPVMPQWLKNKCKQDIHKTTTRKYKSYTENEIHMLTVLFKNGRSNAEIAERLQRTQYSIEKMLTQLHLSRKKYNDYELNILKKQAASHTLDELAKKLPLRTKESITRKCKTLHLTIKPDAQDKES